MKVLVLWATEANSGSDPASMTTKAKKVAGGFELNGSKMWISNAPIADVFVIWAKSEFHENKIKGFILEKNFDGLETKKYREIELACFCYW